MPRMRVQEEEHDSLRVPSSPWGLHGASQLWNVCSEMGKGRAQHPGHWIIRSQAMDCLVFFGPFLMIFFLQRVHVINFPSQFCWAWAIKVSLDSLSMALMRWCKSWVMGQNQFGRQSWMRVMSHY